MRPEDGDADRQAPGGPDGGLDSLDRQILQLMLEGRVSSEVATQLGLPVWTVRARLRRLCQALGASSRIEAILIAVRRQLIKLPDP